jgi:hypothetical protein
MWMSQDVSEERAVCFRITAVHDDVAAQDHLLTLRDGSTRPPSDRVDLHRALRAARPNLNYQ